MKRGKDELHLDDSDIQYIARISHGKDSLKMLDVIVTRGLRLDRITTTDVWATDSVRGELPEMVEFKNVADEYIWKKYRIEVEHLCARNKDGSKKTYEQMFYHVPVRRSQSVQVERERETDRARRDPRIPGLVESVVSGWTQTECERLGDKDQSRGSRGRSVSTGAKSSNLSRMRHQGFPAQISPWCRKLKIDKVRTPFSIARHDGRREISWNIWA